MVDPRPSASGRGLARQTTLARHGRQPRSPLPCCCSRWCWPCLATTRRRSASLQAIQANINEKQAAIENARAKEGVLTSDISALSKRIRTLTREIGSLRRREARVQNTLDARRAQLARVQARYQVEHERFVRLRRSCAARRACSRSA